MELSPAPSGLEAEHEALFTPDALRFLHELISTFDKEVDEVRRQEADSFISFALKSRVHYLLKHPAQILRLRASRKAHIELSGELPHFPESSGVESGDRDWRVRPVPPRLQRRHVDVGDLAPCDTERFIQALQSPAQGIQVGTPTPLFIPDAFPIPFPPSGLFAQVDFDDGNCPTYRNQIKGLHNVLKAVLNQLPGKSEAFMASFGPAVDARLNRQTAPSRSSGIYLPQTSQLSLRPRC